MNVQELKAAFDEKFVGEWNARMETASARARRIHTKPRTETAWQNHMAAVVCGKVDEEPATGGVEPEYAEGFGAFDLAGGMILQRPGGIRASVATTAGRDGLSSDRKSWVLVMLPTGPAALTVEEAYALGGRELKAWPV